VANSEHVMRDYFTTWPCYYASKYSSENGANLVRLEVCNSDVVEQSRFLGLAQCCWASRCSERSHFRNARSYSLNDMAPRPRTHD